jgi:ketosteroid isomerase-like protein
MPEQSASPELLGLIQGSVDALNAGNLDAATAHYADDAVWQAAGDGLASGERFEGRAAIRAFFEEWIGTLEDATIDLEESRDLGHGVTFCRFVQRGRPFGSTGFIEFHYATVAIWADGLAQTDFGYTDADEARAAAEQLAKERE